MQVSVHADGESCGACPPPYADQPQGQLQRQHTNAQQTLVQHETHDQKKLELTSALGSIYIAKVGSGASHGDLLAVVAQALCTVDLNRAAAFNLSLFIYLDESFKSGHFASAVNEGDDFVKA